jgi:hypothetical protein
MLLTLRTKREKKKEDGTRKERRIEEKKRIELNVIRMNSQYITKKKKKIDDRSYVCMFVALCFFKHIEEDEEEKRKRQNIDFNIISSLFLLSIYRIPIIIQ